MKDLEVWGVGGDGITEDLSWRCKQVLHPISGNSQTARFLGGKLYSSAKSIAILSGSEPRNPAAPERR